MAELEAAAAAAGYGYWRTRNVVESTLARGKPLPAFKLKDFSNDEAFAPDFMHAMDGTCLQATATTAPAFAPATDVKDGASTQAPAKTQEASSSNTTVLPIDLTLNDVLEWDFVGNDGGERGMRP